MAYPFGVLLGLAVLLEFPAANADVDSVQGTATGVIVSGFLGSIPPTPTVGVTADETSAPAALGPFTGAAAGTSLPGFPGLFFTGALSVAASAGNLAGENHAGFVEARTTVQNVNAGGGLATATSITSTCNASGNGATGTTDIQGGMLNGAPFANGTPAPNTVVEVPGIGTVTLNEQVRNNVPGAASITVNAVHARYASGPGGILPGGQSAEAIIGQVVCQAVGPDVNVPTTTTTTTTPVAPSTTVVPVTTAARATTTAPQSLATSGAESGLVPGILLLGMGVVLVRRLGRLSLGDVRRRRT